MTGAAYSSANLLAGPAGRDLTETGGRQGGVDVQSQMLLAGLETKLRKDGLDKVSGVDVI